MVACLAVAEVRPFRALTYDRSVAGPLGDLVSPPYDVISAEQRLGYLDASAFNAVRLILPEVEYEEVAGLIADWRARGVLTRAESPVMIGWTQTFTLPDGATLKPAGAGADWGPAVDESTLAAKPDDEILETIRVDCLEGAYYLIDYRGYEGYEPGDNVVFTHGR